MALFRKGGKRPAVTYDPEKQLPAVRRSICTGEMTAGFIDRETGKFHDVALVDGRKGLEDFCREIGANPEEIRTIY